MNNIYVPFNTTNYRNLSSGVSLSAVYTPALSGYTLSITPFTFQLDFELAVTTGEDIQLITQFQDFILSQDEDNIILQSGLPPTNLVANRIVWYFDDDTYSTAAIGKHHYSKPGIYTVSCVLFDANGQSYNNTYTSTLTVFNYVEDKTIVNVASSFITSLTSISGTSQYYILTASNIRNPFEIYRQSSWQTVDILSGAELTYTLFSLSGTDNFFKQGLQTNKYGHLYSESSFFEFNNGEFVETQTATTNSVSLYCKLSNLTVVDAAQDDVGSVFSGTSGTKLIYYKDDLPYSANVSISALSSTGIDLYISPAYKIEGQNNIPIILRSHIIPNTSLSALAITSNGISGEGAITTVFDIDPIKYVSQKVNFVITVKDSSWFTFTQNVNLSAGLTTNVNSLTVIAVNSSGVPIPTIGTFVTNISYLSAVSGGFYRGYFLPTLTATDISLSALANVGGGLYSGRSSTFSVYPSGGAYSIAKTNEDFDWQSKMKELRFQEFLLDNTVLFDDFFGTIYGNLSSEPLSLGKVAYEKISNFTTNKQDINRCDIDSLFGMSFELQSNFKQFEKRNFNYPTDLRRLVDILSINHSRLWGAKNKFNLNFDTKFGANSAVYGANLGTKLDFYNTPLSTVGGFVVAYEKYSSTYRLCNTYNLTGYDLDDFNPSWGWNLVLGDIVSGGDILQYYDFYSYKNAIDGTVVDNTINFDDIFTTISYTNSSYNDWIDNGGIVDNILMNTLYTGVNLLST